VGTIISTIVAVIVGGGLATATVIGVVSSQSAAPDKSPVDVTSGQSSVVEYGTGN